MSNEITTWDSVVQTVMPQFEKIARINNQVQWQVESQFALQTIQKNSGLAKCSITSIQDSIINVASVGLTLNPADGYAYLVPEYSKALKGNECQLRISFKGLIKVATDAGSIKWVKAEIVKANDNLEYKGPCTMPVHSMDPFGDRGDTVGVYCIAKTNDGDVLVDLMNIEELKKIQSCAKTQMVWTQWPDEMAKKAIIKRASKQWPKTDQSSQLHKAVEVINETEGGTDPFAELENIADEVLQLLNLPEPDLSGVGQIWSELTQKECDTLWTAKTKGGWFSTKEKELIRQAGFEYHKSNITA